MNKLTHRELFDRLEELIDADEARENTIKNYAHTQAELRRVLGAPKGTSIVEWAKLMREAESVSKVEREVLAERAKPRVPTVEEIERAIIARCEVRDCPSHAGLARAVLALLGGEAKPWTPPPGWCSNPTFHVHGSECVWPSMSINTPIRMSESPPPGGARDCALDVEAFARDMDALFRARSSPFDVPTVQCIRTVAERHTIVEKPPARGFVVDREHVRLAVRDAIEEAGGSNRYVLDRSYEGLVLTAAIDDVLAQRAKWEGR